jgi:hypothetical protein
MQQLINTCPVRNGGFGRLDWTGLLQRSDLAHRPREPGARVVTQAAGGEEAVQHPRRLRGSFSKALIGAAQGEHGEVS